MDKLDVIKEKIEAKEKQIDEELKRQDPENPNRYKTMSAFVVFEEDESYEKALQWENIAKYRHSKEQDPPGYGGRQYDAVGYIPEEVEGYKQTDVHIVPAEEPDTILWENIEYSQANRNCRKRIVNLVLLFVLVLGFFGIIILSFYKTDVTYLKACGDMDTAGSILYHDDYYPEDELCPLDFQLLVQKNLTGALVEASGLTEQWTGQSYWRQRCVPARRNALLHYD
eukprot:SAG31_NODE_198_length_20656_cov_5.167291_14_plen_226_part_00